MACRRTAPTARRRQERLSLRDRLKVRGGEVVPAALAPGLATLDQRAADGTLAGALLPHNADDDSGDAIDQCDPQDHHDEQYGEHVQTKVHDGGSATGASRLRPDGEPR